jgi:hypothetical protein
MLIVIPRILTTLLPPTVFFPASLLCPAAVFPLSLTHLSTVFPATGTAPVPIDLLDGR